jgi:hypothetical protein
VRDGKCTCGYDCASPGKHPLVKNGFYQATIEPTKIKLWWRKWPWANIGVRTGAGSGIVVLDLDQKDEALESLRKLEEKCGPLPDTLEAKTGSGGRHIFFKHPGVEIPCGANVFGPGIDIRGDGGYVVAPPSKHISGHRYEWDVGTFGFGIAPFPQCIIELLQSHPLNQSQKPKPKGNFNLSPEQQEAVERILYEYLPGAKKIGRKMIVGYLEDSRSKAHIRANLEIGAWTDWHRNKIVEGRNRPVGGNIKQLLRLLGAPIPPELAKRRYDAGRSGELG